jgi:membrane protease YdiL (CAAX protease family)
MYFAAPHNGADASPGYWILIVVVVLYVIYRLAVRRSRRIPPRRPKY